MAESLFAKLSEYRESGIYPYHMPGHKRQAVGILPQALAGSDITEIEGFDNLHQPEGILLEAKERAAALYHAKETYFLVNGSSCGILAAISAALPYGGELLIARNCHKSVYHGADLRGLILSYLEPELQEEVGICEPVSAQAVEQALREHPGVQAVCIVSPTYEGRIADVEKIAEAVHAHDLPLIVDEAHGAHLGFHPAFEKSSLAYGADVVIQSVHKTLPSLTQTALLHLGSDRVPKERIERFLRIYQTSSPSYLLMASIEGCISFLETDAEPVLDVFVKRWRRMLADLSGLKFLTVFPSADTQEKKSDIGKLVISVKNTAISGRMLYERLLMHYRLQMEMVCDTYVLAMFTLADTPEGYERLTKALLEIDGELAKEGGPAWMQGADRPVPERRYLPRKHRARLRLCEARDGKWQWKELSLAAGRCAAEFVNIYPPGVPILVPGEEITKEDTDELQYFLDRGLSVQGTEKHSGVWEIKVLEDRA